MFYIFLGENNLLFWFVYLSRMAEEDKSAINLFYFWSEGWVIPIFQISQQNRVSSMNKF